MIMSYESVDMRNYESYDWGITHSDLRANGFATCITMKNLGEMSTKS